MTGRLAGKTALDHYEAITPPLRAMYQERRDAFVGGLRKLGWDVPTPQATFYVWIPCPKGLSSLELSGRLLEEADVLVDGMRGSSSLWYRIRVNLQHVPEAQRPEQAELEVDYDPWKGYKGAQRPPARR